MIKFSFFTIALASTALAQLRVPVAGYAVYADSAQVRPILGVPGAALVGPPVALPEGSSSVAISPDQQFAILSGADQLSIVSLGPNGFEGANPVEGAISSPDRIAFSGGSSAAALYSAQSNRIQIVTGLPATPQLARDLILNSDVQAFAISNDGGMLLAADSNGNVSLLAADGSTRLVASADSIAALQFLPDSSRALLVDRTRNRVLMLTGLPDSPSVKVLLDEASGLDSPVALQLASDGRHVVIANSGGSNLWSVNLDTAEAVSIACACRPSFLQPLLKGAFLVGEDDRKTAWLFDPDAARIIFVPVLAP